MRQQIHLKSLRAHVYRAPISTPVMTSFGTMRDRPMVVVKVEDHDGAMGIGEAWCNYPAVGAEHRARLIESILAPLATTKPHDGPQALFDYLTSETQVLAIQAGEAGPFAQSIAGVDIAIWDLVARKQGKPLWRLIGGTAPTVRVYASGLSPTSPEQLARTKHDEGYRAFKLKIGFGAKRDIANLDALRRELGPDVELMADVNQAWTLKDALDETPRLERFELTWLEEPLRADRAWEDWVLLKAKTQLPLAAGENICGAPDFEEALAVGALAFVQPDLAKWGGFSGCKPIAERVVDSNSVYCPHYLGGGIGLLASAHLLAGVGGPGRLEIDANENPLRTMLCAPLNDICNGCATLSEKPGLGIEIGDWDSIHRYRVAH